MLRLLFIYALILAILCGVIKCDINAIQRRMVECQNICKPNKVIETFSIERCFCERDYINEK